MVPTLLDLMGIRPPKHLPGKSLVPLIRGNSVAEDHVFIEWNPGPGAVRRLPKGSELASTEDIKRVAQESTRTVISPDGWKLCLSDKDKCQLFNLNTDPGETKNLFYSGQHPEVIQRLTGEIRQWQDKVNDKLILPEN
jgi:arylsulfatase A-like enzyme